METTTAMPVALELGSDLAARVGAHVEAELGWQVVAEDGPLVPVLRLADRVLAGRATVMVVEGEPDVGVVREAVLAGALDVIGWPADRDRLVTAAARAQTAASPIASGPTLLRIAGLAGGVGASTLALTIGACAAWAGHATVVVGGEDLLGLAGAGGWAGPDALALAALGPDGARAELLSCARAVPGVERLWLLRGPLASVAGWPVDLVVVDQGTAAVGADLLVARCDAGLRRAAHAGARAPVVLIEQGPAGPGVVKRLLGRPPSARLPHSARVTRAGLAGRVPGGLPGSYVAAVRDALRAARRVPS